MPAKRFLNNDKYRRTRLSGVALMMIKISGRHAVSGPVGISACLLFCHTASARQQEYIVSDAQNNTAERYTWDADHQPRYEDILAERIQSSQNLPGLAPAVPSGATTDAAMSPGWNFPVSARITTGPVMSGGMTARRR